MKVKKGNTVIRLREGDITESRTEAIVNPANSLLTHGGGVAGLIVKKGGPAIQEESDIWLKVKGGFLSPGSAAITTAGDLPCKYVIHAVGPRLGEGDEDYKLKRATLAALQTAASRCIKTVTFPAISTGIFGFPMDRCAAVMLTAVFAYTAGSSDLSEIVFCLYGAEAFAVFKSTFKKLK